MQKFFKKKGIQFEGYTSLKDEAGADLVEEMVLRLQAEAEADLKRAEMRSEKKKSKHKSIIRTGSDSDEEEEEKKSKIVAPEYLLIPAVICR